MTPQYKIRTKIRSFFLNLASWKKRNRGNATPQDQQHFVFFQKNIPKRILYGSLKLAGFEGMNLSQTAKTNHFLYFLIELIEIYLPIPIVCFSNERNEAPSPKYCSCKVSLYQGFFENLGVWRFDPIILCSFFIEISINNTRKAQLQATDGL